MLPAISSYRLLLCTINVLCALKLVVVVVVAAWCSNLRTHTISILYVHQYCMDTSVKLIFSWILLYLSRYISLASATWLLIDGDGHDRFFGFVLLLCVTFIAKTRETWKHIKKYRNKVDICYQNWYMVQWLISVYLYGVLICVLLDER